MMGQKEGTGPWWPVTGAVRLYQSRDWQVSGGGAIAAPRGFVRLAPVAVAAAQTPRFSLVVDLGEELFSASWWRGTATLALMAATLGLITPWPAPLPGGNPDQVSDEQQAQLTALGIAPPRIGGLSGGRMAASARVETLIAAPERAHVEMSVRIGANDRIGSLLVRIGAMPADAARVAQLVQAQAPRGIAPGTSIFIRLGRKGAAGQRPIERVALRVGLDLDLAIDASSGGFVATATPIAIDATPRRIRGRVGDGLYWSLRAAGVAPATAGDYLKALATQIDLGSELGASDRFDLIVANRRAATGDSEAGTLLYAAIERLGGRPIRLMKWSVGGRSDWYEASSLQAVSASAMLWPVSAPVTSEFGMRYHPILHFARMHMGMDFGARWGTPIFAPADGQVTAAGWAGGYGQQVRLAHGGGIGTSFSHMSRMVVEPGMLVHQGQVIGYVGTTGLSTGPHLHYETYLNGVAVNPRSVRLASAPTADPGALAAFRARLKALLQSAKG